jgi:DNA protecting protein DprA
MEQRRSSVDIAERDAVLGLWAIPGVGPVALGEIRRVMGGALAPITDVPVREWLERVSLPDVPRAWLSSVTTLRELAGLVRDCARNARMRIDYLGEEGYPEKLGEIADAPPVLFSRGRVGVERRRVAVVGSRHPDHGCERYLRGIVEELARSGLCVVSGAAYGLDAMAHYAAMDSGGETWAFVAAGLDELDAAQASLAARIVESGGRVLTEYPPGVRPDRPNFPRRNRLISGAADAVVILRAKRKSGSLHTAAHALEQGRPLFAVPGDFWNESVQGCLDLLQSGRARLCTRGADVLHALGVAVARMAGRRPPGRGLDELELSETARRVHSALGAGPRVLEEIQSRSGLEPSELVCALAELELSGLAVQHPGRVYDKA